MQHLVGYFENVDQGGAAANIAAMPDETLYAVGDVIRVPNELPFLLGAAVLTAASTFTSAQVRTPSLRTKANFDISGYSDADDFYDYPNIDFMPMAPVPLEGLESMTFQTNTDHAAAVDIQGLVWLSDGPLQPVTGQMFTVRCTAAAALSDGTWANSNLTFTQELPTGQYNVVGLRIESANSIAGRLVFPGGKWRPGAPAVVNPADRGDDRFRYGRSGVFGSFDSNVPPTIDITGHTDVAQDVFLDLIRTS